jgi:hypothetical protein
VHVTSKAKQSPATYYLTSTNSHGTYLFYNREWSLLVAVPTHFAKIHTGMLGILQLVMSKYDTRIQSLHATLLHLKSHSLLTPQVHCCSDPTAAVCLNWPFGIALRFFEPLISALFAVFVELSSVLVLRVRHCAYLRFGLSGWFWQLAALVRC